MSNELTIKKLKQLLKDDFKFFSYDKIPIERETGTIFNFYLYTKEHEYAIRAREASSTNTSYLGCIMSNRYPRTGETWLRGNDLADGPLTLETWVSILSDILSLELVTVKTEKDSNGRLQILDDTGDVIGAKG